MESLIPLVTTDPTPNVMTIATGIPPHIKLIQDFNYFASKLHDLLSNLEILYVGLNNIESDVIEEKMSRNASL